MKKEYHIESWGRDGIVSYKQLIPTGAWRIVWEPNCSEPELLIQHSGKFGKYWVSETFLALHYPYTVFTNESNK